MWAECTVPRAPLHEQSEHFRGRLYTSRWEEKNIKFCKFYVVLDHQLRMGKVRSFYERVAYLFNNLLGEITYSVPELWGIGPPTPDG
ncbi:hypothetical protein J6590_085377 [Homalodisca vitripennis]|nr:hypothetical protein J6590_085377 [Homalodisca vitripennis]